MKLTQLIWFVSVVVLTALSSMVLMILVKRMNEAPRLTMENVDFGETIQSNESMVVSTKIFNRSSQDVKLVGCVQTCACLGIAENYLPISVPSNKTVTIDFLVTPSAVGRFSKRIIFLTDLHVEGSTEVSATITGMVGNSR